MAKYIHLFFARIAKDFKQKELLPVKFLFFVQMSTILVLYPYLTIHMRELGINVEETAIMSAVTPVVGILMPPLAGMLADKIGNFRVLLAAFSVFGGLSALLLLLVPVGRITITYPDTLVMGLTCNSDSHLDLILPQEYSCVPKKNISEIDIKIQSCGFVCPIYSDTIDDDEIFWTRSYDVQIHDLRKNETSLLHYDLTDDDIYVPKMISETRNHETFKGNDRYSTAIRKFSKNSYFFPSIDLYNLNCHENLNENTEYNVTTSDDVEFLLEDSHGCPFTEGLQGFNKTFKVGVKLNPMGEFDKLENTQNYTVKYIQSEGRRYQSTCAKDLGQDENLISILVHNNYSETFDLDNCLPKCIASTPRKQLCANANTVVEFDIKLTFWSYLAVRVFIGIIGGTAYTMFEGAVIAILREYKADYGLQRMYASIGGMISSPLSGWLIDYASKGKGYTDFRPVFFLYAVLKVISAGMMLFINLEFKTPAASVVSDVLSLLNIELISLFVASFLLGSAWGYIESFLFWLIQDLGGSKSLMGLTITVGGIVGIPLLVLSGPFIKKVGHANVIFIGFIAYAIRLMGYSIIYNPWLSLIFEAMECLTHSLCFTAAVTYAARLSTVTTDTTIQGIFGGLFYGVGKSAGSLVGGYLIKAVGMRRTFQIFALMTGFTGLLYMMFYHLYMKKRSVLTAPVIPEPEKPPRGYEDVDLTKTTPNGNLQIDIVDKIKSVPYEDTLTNLAYEDNEEFDVENTENEEKTDDLNKLEVVKTDANKS